MSDPGDRIERWRTRSSTVRYENRWIRVHEDEVVRPDGDDGIYGVVEIRQPSVFVVAITDADEVVLVDVDRYTVGRSLEVPAGGTDGEAPLIAARRELREETGLDAEDWSEVGRMNALNGVCRAPEHVVVARGVRRVGTGDGADEEGIVGIQLVSWPRLWAMVGAGEITDAETLAALTFAAVALGHVG
ncbi:MAG: NUDIX domain-containing protein [Desertimonas sp.]